MSGPTAKRVVAGGVVVMALAGMAHTVDAQTVLPTINDFSIGAPEPSALQRGTSHPAEDETEAAPEHRRAWTFVPYLDVQEIVTDNVRLAPHNKEADLVSAITPGFGLAGQSRRLSANLDTSLTYNKYASATDLDGPLYNLYGNALGELMEGVLFLDVRSAINQEGINPGGLNSAVQRTLPANQVRVINSSISPYVHEDFDQVSAGLRYRLSVVDFTDESKGSTASPTLPGTVNFANGWTNEFNARLASGPLFSRFKWDIEGDEMDSHYTGHRLVQSRSILGSVDYALNRWVALLAEAGFESERDSGTGLPADSSPVWLGGFRLTPGPRASLTIKGGERYNAPYWSGELTYKLTPSILLTASHDVSVTTEQERISASLNDLVRDQQGRLIDVATGLPVNPNRLPFNFVSQIYTEAANRFTVSGERGRNRFVVTAMYLTRDVGALGLDQSGNDHQQVVEFDSTYTRQLSRKSDASLLVSLARTYDAARENQDSTALLGLSYGYGFSDTLRGTLSLRHYALSDPVGTGYRENVALVGLHKEF